LTFPGKYSLLSKKDKLQNTNLTPHRQRQLMMHRKSVGRMLWASMGLWLLRRLEKKEAQDQR